MSIKGGTRLSNIDKSILGYKPEINFVEPEFEGEVVRGLAPKILDSADIEAKWDTLDKKAQAGKLLAEAFQGMVDQKVGDFSIALDPIIDSGIKQSIRRRFPGADDSEITFSQYRECREAMRERGLQNANGLVPNLEEVKNIRLNPDQSVPIDFDSAEARKGLLRPELQKEGQIIEPLDIEGKFLPMILCQLANILWQKFVKPFLPPPLNWILPDEICKIGDEEGGALGEDDSFSDFGFGPDSGNEVGDSAGAANLAGAFTKEGIPTFKRCCGFQDCQNIIRAFEKGAAYSTDERSVFAMMTPFLQDTQVMADVTGGLVRNNKGDRLKNLDSEIKEELAKARESATSSDDGQLSEASERASKYTKVPSSMSYGDEGSNTLTMGLGLQEEFQEDVSFLDKIKEHAKECIPCDLRLVLDEILALDKWSLLKTLTGIGVGEEVYNALDKYWNSVMERSRELLGMFKDLDQYVDICAFLKFIQKWVCFPDISRILAALFALLMDIGAILDGFGIDLALSLLAPLVMPALQNLVDLLEDFLLIIIKPLECLIDGAMNFLNKLNWGEIQLPTKATIRFFSGPSSSVRSPSSSPEDTGTRSSQEPHDFSVAGTFMGQEYDFSGQINPMNEDYADDPSWSRTFDTGGAAISKGLQSSWDKSFGVVSEGLKEASLSMRSMLQDLIFFMRKAVTKFENLMHEVLEEFQKLISEYILGYSMNIGRANSQKLAILRLIGLLLAIRKAFQEKPQCDEENAENLMDSELAKIISLDRGYTVWEDDDGEIHLSESEESLRPAREILGSVIGDDGKGGGGAVFNTGDDVVDAQLAGIVEKMLTPVNVVFGCPHNMTLSDVDQINDWVSGG